ncbi:MAG: phage holin family protein [Candidatus Rokuibacteriota bacterium]|nr:MAG: phage holin family protein [Candidatus Rokubacteria bacterium]
MGFVLRALVNAATIVVASAIVPGIGVDSAAAALLAGVVLGLINALVRPILVVLTLPLTLVTLGLFLLVLNGICLALTAWLVPGLHVAGFGAAVLGALVISLVSWLLTAFVSDRGHIERYQGRIERY